MATRLRSSMCSQMFIFLPRFYVINSFFYVLCPKWPKNVMLYCSISTSSNEMFVFGVIQSHDILGHIVKCYYAIGSIRYWTYYMISTIYIMKTFKGTLR